MMSAITLKDILAARQRISHFVKTTPVLTCKEADKRSGRQLFFKSEHLQSTGSFKVRGATNAVRKQSASSASLHPHVDALLLVLSVVFMM